MRFTWLKVIGVLIIVSSFTFVMTVTVVAEDKFYAKQGFYLGVMVPYNSIDGDFDGKTVLTAPTEIIAVPKVESDYGWGIILGGRSQRGAFELSYLRSTHDISWLGFTGEATYNIVNLDGKYYFLADKPLQPYLLGGLCIPWLVAKDCSTDGIDIGDARFSGIGFNIGSGIAAYLNPKVSVSAGIVYRWISYGEAKGVDGTSRDIEDSLDGSGVNFNFGMTFTF